MYLPYHLNLSINQHRFDLVVKQFFVFHSSQLAHCEEELNESKDLNAFLQDQIDEIKMQVVKILILVLSYLGEGGGGQYYRNLYLVPRGGYMYV